MDPLTTLPQIDNRAEATGLLAWLDRCETAMVERCVEHARRRRLIGIARLITRAGNGWMYPIASAALFAASLHRAAQSLAAAAASVVIAFIVYPPLKRMVARPRPCQVRCALGDSLPPLDRYSFPSGHAMTAAAFGVPLMLAAPELAVPVVIGVCLAMGWSRMALGHHYLSDLIAGTLIGAFVAAAVTIAFTPI